MRQIRLLLADDRAEVRAGLRLRLRREADFEIVGEAASSAEAIQLALRAQPDVILIEPMMRDQGGVYAIKQIAAQLPHTRIVALTTVADTLLRMTLRDLGVQHILDKGIESHHLIDVLRKAARPSDSQSS
jgi:two-component system nitrate/nitrite response regulator NarL